MALPEYVVRFTTASLVRIKFKGNDCQIETAVAKGIGKYEGVQMVLVGEVFDDGKITSTLCIPPNLVDQAVVDEAVDLARLSEGTISNKHDRRGLWIPFEQVDILLE